MRLYTAVELETIKKDKSGYVALVAQREKEKTQGYQLITPVYLGNAEVLK